MDMSITDLLKNLMRETWERKVLSTILFVITAILFLVLALIWPKVYTSSSTIFVDRQNILRPLMEGTAVTTSAQDRAKIAREIVFSRKSMSQILQAADWFDSEPSAIERDQKIESIKKRTEFRNSGDNLLRISFKDELPRRAYETTKLMSEIIVDETLRTKREESRAAFEFINSQVEEYHKKLQNAEQAIKDFRSRNIDATPGAEAAADERLLQLKRQLEGVEMEIYEERSKLEARRRQLAGESGTQNSGSIARESQLSARIQQLEERLADLRLTYMEDYPDIVQLKGQIQTLEDQIKQEIETRNSGSNSGNTELRDGPIAQELRRQILRSQTTLSSLDSRKQQIENLMERERATKDRINAVEAEMAELTRDNQVNQQMYQQLLEQRENARISMNIDIENQGLTVKIQESASLPVTPKGIRFAHIVLAGLVLSIFVPIGISYGLSMIDQKVRDAKVITEGLGLPVLASVYTASTPAQKKSNFMKASVIGLIAFSIWALYGYQIYLRVAGIS
ncbi:XrtA system polysaccharide chain length determinant [Aliikangiella sp. G2MR2-5]|uniref:XrtA system polysaccharide chain length determinant n=1 Tax=Aliikangiella sp. G2MR2-5 TaxID=2788943 RepID=UPI0018ABC437|nr:XrtA system polysaccharide chain length determinant [Aliikangiella sp. G2MR2-5]